MIHYLLVLKLIFLTIVPTAWSSDWENALKQLGDKKFTQVESAVKALGRSDDPKAKPLLETMLENKLYQMKRSKILVRAEGKRNDFKTYDVFTGKELASGVKKRELKRIRVNNRIRSS